MHKKSRQFDVSQKINDACKPLKDIFGINFFIYQRSFIDLDRMCVTANAYLCNNEEILSYVLSLTPQKREKAKYDYTNKKERKYVLLETTQPKFAAILRDKFNFCNILCRDELIDKNEWEHLIIGTPASNTEAINNYLNNQELLEKFVCYFRDQAGKLINDARCNRLPSGRPIEKCSFYNRTNSDNANYSFNILNPRHYYLTNNYGKKIPVPMAEMRCLLMLAKGRSRKEIANEFGISFRTVESHIKNAKNRLQCKTRGGLLDVLENWKKSNNWIL